MWYPSCRCQKTQNKVRPRAANCCIIHNTRQERNEPSVVIEHIHALRAASLPLHHHDPFDRLLITQAQIVQIPFMTVDTQFKPYDIEVIWAG